jgi:CRP-like cAMP-binding protein
MNKSAREWELRMTEMDLFTGLDLGVMGEIADVACEEASFEKGALIFSEGEAARTLYILDGGTVDLMVGREKIVYSLTEQSDIFGWSSLIENAPYTATALAQTKVQALKINTRKMNRLFEAHPSFGLAFYRRLAAVFNKRLASIYARFLKL